MLVLKGAYRRRLGFVSVGQSTIEPYQCWAGMKRAAPSGAARAARARRSGAGSGPDEDEVRAIEDECGGVVEFVRLSDLRDDLPSALLTCHLLLRCVG